MTAPYADRPDGAFVVGDDYGQDVTEAGVRAAIRGDNLGQFQGAQGQWHGVQSDLAGIADQLLDGQLALTDRVDLLEAVEGYCSLYMSANWTVPGGRRILLPFDSQLGPAKGATPLDGVAIRMGERGLWRADCHVSFAPRPSSWTATAAGFVVYLSVVNIASGSVFTERVYDIVISPTGAETASFSTTFVIPTDNAYKVWVQVEHRQSGHKVYGGTLYSALSVNKWDNGTDNAVSAPTVPDGGTLS